MALAIGPVEGVTLKTLARQLDEAIEAATAELDEGEELTERERKALDDAKTAIGELAKTTLTGKGPYEVSIAVHDAYGAARPPARSYVSLSIIGPEPT